MIEPRSAILGYRRDCNPEGAAEHNKNLMAISAAEELRALSDLHRTSNDGVAESHPGRKSAKKQVSYGVAQDDRQ
jgi:hypothetical protein